MHPISARESRALRKLLREAPASPYVFISERHAPVVRSRISAHGCQGGGGCEIYVHMLRHACGFKLANDGVVLLELRRLRQLQALPPGWTQMCLEGTVVLRLRRAGRATPAEILLDLRNR